MPKANHGGGLNTAAEWKASFKEKMAEYSKAPSIPSHGEVRSLLAAYREGLRDPKVAERSLSGRRRHAKQYAEKMCPDAYEYFRYCMLARKVPGAASEKYMQRSGEILAGMRAINKKYKQRLSALGDDSTGKDDEGAANRVTLYSVIASWFENHDVLYGTNEQIAQLSLGDPKKAGEVAVIVRRIADEEGLEIEVGEDPPAIRITGRLGAEYDDMSVAEIAAKMNEMRAALSRKGISF